MFEVSASKAYQLFKAGLLTEGQLMRLLVFAKS